jgi:hypothetical protein
MATFNSSVGGLGRQLRSYNRDYWTYEDAITIDNINNFKKDIKDFLPNFREDISRNVMRAVMSTAALEQVLDNNDVRKYLEAVAPLRTGENLVYFANNDVSKRGRSSHEDWRYDANIPIEQTDLPEGYGFVSHENISVSALKKIWQPFSWDESAIKKRFEELTEANSQEKGERRVWLAGIANTEGQLVSAATAEGIVLPSAVNDDGVLVVEYTEFATSPNEKGKKLIVQVVGKLIQSVWEDVGDVDGIAECNISSKSYRSAVRAGFAVQDEFAVNNVLKQNVEIVGDKNNSELKDFLLLYLPKGIQP